MTTPQGMLDELAKRLENMACFQRENMTGTDRFNNFKNGILADEAAAALRLSAAPSAARVCPKCDGTKEIEYEITYHGDRNERVRDKCNGCGGTGVISASPAGNEGRDIERIMFEIYKYGYQNRHDWPEERMWDDFKATRGSIFWDNAKRAAEAISALTTVVAPDGARAWPSDGDMLILLQEAGYDIQQTHPGCYYAFGWKTFTEKLRAALDRHPHQPVEDIQDQWFTDSSLPIMAMSGDVESDRVLKLHFRRKVTDAERARFLDVLNAGEKALAHPLEPATEAGELNHRTTDCSDNSERSSKT